MIREDRYAIAGLVGLTILLFSPFLFSWPAPFIYPVSSLGTDLPREIFPLAHFVKRLLLSTGQLPLWRPYLLSGAPLVGHPVAPLFYPPHWLSLVFPISLAFNIDIAIHCFWMALGTYIYLRLETSTRWEAAILGAIVFSQAPIWIAHISGGHLPMIAAIAWWPWIWLGCCRYLSTAKVRWVVLAGIGLAGQLLNHGMFAILSLIAIAALSLARFLRDQRPAPKSLLRGWAVALGVAFPLSAIQTLPFLALVRLSNRASITFEEATFGSLPPPLLLASFFPPDLKFPEWFLYPGIGVLALAAYGLATGWSKREKRAALTVLIGIVLSLGSNTPIYRILYSILPGYSALRVPARWWLFSLFALGLLAAWGLEKWLSRVTPRGPWPMTLQAILGLFYGVAAFLKVDAGGSFPFNVLPSAAGMLILLLILRGTASRWKLVLLITVVILDLWWTAAGLLRPQPEVTSADSNPIVSVLQDAARDGGRSFAPYGGVEMAQLESFSLRGADGYDSFVLDAYSRLGEAASGCDYQGYSASVPSTASNPAAIRSCPNFRPRMDLLALLNVRYIILPESVGFHEGSFVVAHNGLRLFEISPGVGRAYGVQESVVVPPDQCIDTLLRIDLDTQAILEEDLPLISVGYPPSVISRSETLNNETFIVDVSVPGILVRSESWAPGWKASIDGQATELLKANCALQGVRLLEPGTHTVVFTYAPQSFAAGFWISISACVLLLFGTGCRVYQSRKFRNSRYP